VIDFDPKTRTFSIKKQVKKPVFPEKSLKTPVYLTCLQVFSMKPGVSPATKWGPNI
jgi:hypothetical protein